MADTQGFGLLIQAALDKVSSKAVINQEIKKLQTDALKLGVQIDQSSFRKAITDMQRQTQQAASQQRRLWDGIFKDSISGLTAQNPIASQMRTFYKQQEREAIQSQQNIARQAVQAQKEAAAAQKKIITDNTITTRAKSIQTELLRIKDATKAITNNPAFVKEWQSIFDASNVASTSAEIQNLNARMALLKKESGAVSDVFSKAFKAYLLVKALQLARTGISAVISEVRTLDKSLTNFNKVADLSGTKLKTFAIRAYEVGKQIGRTGRDVIDAVTEFRRAGFELETSLNMSKSALIMTNVSEGITDTAQSAGSLIAILKGFKLKDSDILAVVDRINKVSNESPVGFDNLVDGLTRASGVLSQTGTTIDQTIGLLTGGYSTLRNMEKVATGLITISSRLRGVSEDGEEIEGLAPKLKGAFKEIADIDIEDSNGKLRSTFDILKDLAKVYPTLTSKQQQYLSELSSGLRQSPVLAAIIQQWNDVSTAIDQSTNSLGSATKENEIFMRSIEGRINLLNSAWQELSTNALSSDTVKGIVDASTAIVQAIDKFGGLQNALVAISGLLAAAKLSTVTKFLNNTVLILPNIVNALRLAKIEGIGFGQALKNIGVTASKAQLVLGGITLGITALVGIISAYNQAKEENRRKAIDASNATSDEANSLLGLYGAYSKLSKVTNRTTDQEKEFNTVIQQLNDTLVDKNEALSKVTVGTQEYAKALDDATAAELRAAAIDIAPGTTAARANLLDKYNSFIGRGGINDYELPGQAGDLVKSVLPGYTSGISVFGKTNDSLFYGAGGYSLPKDIVEYYFNLKEAQDLLIKTSQDNNDESIRSSRAYNAVTREIEKLNTVVDDYVKAKVKEESLLYMSNNEIPVSVDEYNAMADSIIKAVGAGEEWAKVIREMVIPESLSSSTATAKESTLPDYSSAVEVFIKSQASANDVLKAQSDAVAITTDNYKKLIEADTEYANALDNTNGYISINAQKLDEINAKKAAEIQSNIKAAKTQALQDYKSNAIQLKANEDALSRLTKEMANSTDATKDQTEEWQNQKKQLEDLIAQYEGQETQIVDTIKGYNRLASELTSATSAYKKWIDAQSGPETGDQYRDTIDTVKELKSMLKEGRINTRSYQAALEYLIPDDIAEKGPKAIQNYTKKLDRYFKDGSKGILQFAKDIAKAKTEGGEALATFDPKTGNFELFKNDLTTIASAMGLTEDAVYALLGALGEYVDIDLKNPELDDITAEVDSAKKNLEETTTLAEEAQKAYDEALRLGNEQRAAEAKAAADEAERKREEAENVLIDAQEKLAGQTPSLSLQDQLTVLQNTLSGFEKLGIPAKFTMNTQVEIAEVQSQIDQSAGSGTKATIPVTVAEGETYRSDMQRLIDGVNPPEGAKITVDAEKGAQYDAVVGEALADQVAINDGANLNVDASEGEYRSVVDPVLQDQDNINSGADLVIEATDNATSVIDDVKTNISNAVKFAEENPVVITVKAQGSTPSGNQSPISNPNDLQSFIEGNEWQSPNPSVKPIEDATEDTGYLVDSIEDIAPTVDSANDSLGQLPGTVSDTTEEVQKQIPWWEALWNWITGQPQPDITVDTSEAKGQVESFVSAMSQKVITIKAKVEPSGAAADSGKKAITKPETVLAAEKRPEILVRDGEYSVLEDPQLLNLKPGDQLIGGAESAKILNGRFKKSGRALDVGDYTASGSGTLKTASLKGGSSFLKSLEKLWDWIPRALDAAKKATDKLLKTVENAVGYIKQNIALDQVISSTRAQIAKNEQAYATYMKQAEEIATKGKLSADIIKKVQDGSIQVELISDKKLREKIGAYQDWWDKAQKVKDTLEELREKENELAKKRLDNIVNDYENRINRIDAKITSGQTAIDRKAALGKQIKPEDYLPMLNAASERMKMLAEQRGVLNAEFEKLIASGVIQKDSEAWHQYIGEIESLGEAISRAEIDVQGFKNSMDAIDITNLQYSLNAIAQSQKAIENKNEFTTSQGRSLSPSDYTSLINVSIQAVANLERQNELYREQQKGLDVLSERYQELQGYINDNDDAIWQAKSSQEQWNDAIKDLRIKELNNQKDALQKVNDEHKKALDLQQAQEDLEKAKQRKIRVLKDGKFVFEADQKAIKDAQNKLDDLRHKETIDRLDKLIEVEEKAKETDNIYDKDGNKIPSYGGGGFHRGTGLALLHDKELTLTPAMGENLLNMLNSRNLAAEMAESLTSQMYKVQFFAPVPSPPQLSFSNLFNVSVSKGEDVGAYLDNVFREAKSRILQEVYKN